MIHADEHYRLFQERLTKSEAKLQKDSGKISVVALILRCKEMDKEAQDIMALGNNYQERYQAMRALGYGHQLTRTMLKDAAIRVRNLGKWITYQGIHHDDNKGTVKAQYRAYFSMFGELYAPILIRRVSTLESATLDDFMCHNNEWQKLVTPK